MDTFTLSSDFLLTERRAKIAFKKQFIKFEWFIIFVEPLAFFYYASRKAVNLTKDESKEYAAKVQLFQHIQEDFNVWVRILPSCKGYTVLVRVLVEVLVVSQDTIVRTH